MTFSDFCEKILIALYQDGHQTDEWLHFDELEEKYGLEVDSSWLSRAMNHLRAQRRIEGREMAGAPSSVLGRITGSGMAYIEGKYGSKDGVGTILEPVSYVQENTGVASASSNIQSATWTGLPSDFALSEEKRTRLVTCLQQAEAGLDFLGIGNQQKAQVRAYIVAAKALADAPEPPVELIWELIQRANAIAGIASLFVSIIALFVA